MNKYNESLMKALALAKIAQKKKGTPLEQYCRIENGCLIATNDFISIGVKIQEEFEACPHTYLFEEALKNVSSEFVLSHNNKDDELFISLNAGNFSALIPCIKDDVLTHPKPDLEIAKINNELKKAFKLIHPIISDFGSNSVYHSVLLQNNSVVGTNGKVLIEYWHGINLPDNLLLPKVFLKAVSTAKADLRGFGFSDTSVTFWFEDNSYIKTRLFNERYPNYKELFKGVEFDCIEIGKEFFEAVKVIKKFSKNNLVYFKNGHVLSNEDFDKSTTFKIENLPDNFGFNVDYLLNVKDIFENVYFENKHNRAYFKTDKVRGLVQGVYYDDKEGLQL